MRTSPSLTSRHVALCEYVGPSQGNLRVGYVRVSTSSGEQLSALEAQRHRIQGEQVDLLLEDVESGLNAERRQYLQLKRLVTNGQVAEVVATRLDRLGRDATESDAFIRLCDQRGVVCRTLDDGVVTMATPEALLMTRLRGSLAEGESMRLSARVRKGLAAGRELGKPMRKPCWGYKLAENRQRLEPHPEQWPHATVFVGLLKQLNWRMSTALESFTGPIPIRSCRGVRAWLLNPTLRGGIAYGQLSNHRFSEVLWDQHPALLSATDYQEMQVVIAANKRMWGVNSKRKLRALTGLCTCSECGYRMVYIPDRTYASLRCRAERCSRRYRGTRETVILSYVVEQLSQSAAAALAAAVDGSDPPEVAALRLQIESLERQGDPDLREAIEKKVQRLKSLLSQPAIDPELTRKIADPRWFDLLTYDELTVVIQQLVREVQLTNGVPVAIGLKL